MKVKACAGVEPGRVLIGKGRHVTGQERVELTRQLVAWYGEGASIRQLADRTGRSYQTVRTILTEAGIAFRPRGRHRPPQPQPCTPIHPDTTYAQVLGSELRRLRKAKGWTRSYMCRYLTISMQTLATYENGTRALAATRLAELCALLGTQPHTVLATVDQAVLPAPNTITVDLAALAATSLDKLLPARRWAIARLRALPTDRPTTATLDTEALDRLGALCGISTRELINTLRATEAEADPDIGPWSASTRF